MAAPTGPVARRRRPQLASAGRNPASGSSPIAGALLLDRLGALDDLSAGQLPARLNLGDTLGPPDMTLLSTIADGWPAL
jgi:hypothetical protein